MSVSSSPSSVKIVNVFSDLLEKQGKIGSGGYGSVYECVHSLDGQHYAVKKIKLNHTKIDWFLREVRALSSLEHKNVVRYFQAWTDVSSRGFSSSQSGGQGDSDEGRGFSSNSSQSGQGDSDEGDGESSPTELENDLYLFIQMEYCPSTLDQKIQEKTISRSKALSYFFRLLEGLIYIHESGYLHRDLTRKNIFIGSGGVIKIGDFGLAKKLSGPQDNRHCSHSDPIGFPLYLAPEILKKQPYTAKSDLYSLGLILFEMLHPPFTTESERVDVLSKVKKGEYPDGWDNLETTVLRMVLAESPDDRSSTRDVFRFIKPQIVVEDD